MHPGGKIKRKTEEGNREAGPCPSLIKERRAPPGWECGMDTWTEEGELGGGGGVSVAREPWAARSGAT
jgi:hypothetical protein